MHASVYSKAVSLGYPYRWGEGRTSAAGSVWLTRFQKTNAPDDTQVIFVGWDSLNEKWVVEHE